MKEMEINNKPHESPARGSDNFIPFQRMDNFNFYQATCLAFFHCLTWIFYDFT